MWEQISFYNEPPLKIHNTVRLIELFSGIGAQAKAFREIDGTVFGDMNGKFLPEEQQEEMRKATKDLLLAFVKNIDAEVEEMVK